MLWTDDVDFIDPGMTYYQPGIAVAYATQKPLYSWKPDDSETPVEDLAESKPEVSEDGKTVTVKIKPGVKFSPPVDREVTSKDVKYAIERGFFNTVNNGYAPAYFGDIVGAKAGVEAGTKIEGIETPDDTTLVFKLKRGTGGMLAGALVPAAHRAGARGVRQQVRQAEPERLRREPGGDGPVHDREQRRRQGDRLRADQAHPPRPQPELGQVDTASSPAYLDEIDMPQGNDDTTVASRKILDGTAMVTGDFDAPPAIIKQALTQ